MSVDHEARLRQVELWVKGHETECTGRHRALNLRFDRTDEAAEAARAEAAAAREAAETAVETAQAGAAAAAIGRATILAWMRAVALTLLGTLVTLLSGSQWGRAAWHFLKG